MAEQEPKQVEPFLTIETRRVAESCMAVCPELGDTALGIKGLFWVAPTQNEAEGGLRELVLVHSRVLLDRALKGELVDGRPVDPTKADLARRVLEVPEARIAEIFRQT